MATYINEITRVSTAYDSQLTQGNGASFAPSISADGRYVLFESEASNLVPGDIGARDVFVRDLQTGAITRVSIGNEARQGGMFDPSMSADGRYLTFFGAGVFVQDLQTGAITRVDKQSGPSPEHFG